MQEPAVIITLQLFDSVLGEPFSKHESHCICISAHMVCGMCRVTCGACVDWMYACGGGYYENY